MKNMPKTNEERIKTNQKLEQKRKDAVREVARNTQGQSTQGAENGYGNNQKQRRANSNRSKAIRKRILTMEERAFFHFLSSPVFELTPASH